MIVYREIIINRGALIFADFVVHLNNEIKIQQNTIFPLIVACKVWNHEIKNPWIDAFYRNHENWCQQIKVLSQYKGVK